MTEQRTEDRWHVGKEVPIALLFAMLVQTGGWIWWAATMSAKIDGLALQVTSMYAEKYTQSDAQKDKALVMEEIADLTRRVAALEQGFNPEPRH